MHEIKMYCVNCPHGLSDPSFPLKAKDGSYTVKCKECDTPMCFLEVCEGKLIKVLNASGVEVPDYVLENIELIPE